MLTDSAGTRAVVMPLQEASEVGAHPIAWEQLGRYSYGAGGEYHGDEEEGVVAH